MPRFPYSSSGVSFSLGPGRVTAGVRAILWLNVAVFVVVFLVPSLTVFLGLPPAAVFSDLWVWQPLTYMFVHREFFHILFNLLAVWMFGVQLERLWGTRAFVRYYLVTGIGAGVSTMLVSLLPFTFATPAYYAVTIGASGAVFGLLLAYAMHYPNQPLFSSMALVNVGGTQDYLFFASGSDALPSNGVNQRYTLYTRPTSPTSCWIRATITALRRTRTQRS